MAEKLTPEEIKKALECCASGKNCEECSLNCKAPTSKDILDLINRQQAEIENADFTIEQLTKGNLQLQAEIERLKNDLAISKKKPKDMLHEEPKQSKSLRRE